MTVIARDAVASDHLVYAWPFPIGPECEVACGDDEQVVMCPAWLVGDRLGPGRHRWRTPDPTRPVAAFFVLTAPVEVSFDMTTMFIIPTTGQPVRLRASGSLQVRCADPGLLIAQFVGLPFDSVNDGILRSVSRSVERMLARLLTRRAVMAASPVAVTDPGMLPGILEELVAYNPTAGAVFGVELIRMGHLAIVADDGSTPYLQLPSSNPRSSTLAANGETLRRVPSRANSPTEVPLMETARQVPPPPAQSEPTKRHASVPPTDKPAPPPLQPPPTPPPSPSLALSSGEIRRPDNMRETQRSHVVPPPAPRRIPVVEIPSTTDEITQPGVHTPVPGSMHRVPADQSGKTNAAMQSSPGIAKTPSQPGLTRTGATQSSPGIAPRADATPPAVAPLATPQEEPRGSILGIGMGAIGAGGGAVAGEIPTKVAPGGRVLVPGPNGLMQSATVRQLLQGYYELEVGSSGETIWVPINGVVPE